MRIALYHRTRWPAGFLRGRKLEIIPDQRRSGRRLHLLTHCPMSLSLQEIERLARLARLRLTPEQALDAQQRLNGFFTLVEQMQAVDTTGVEPLAHPAAVLQPVALRLRPDVASEPNQREANQASAPAVEDGLYLVPRVIE